MPVSHHRNIIKVINTIDGIKPSSILDVGFGFGKYGLLLRERYDVRFKRVNRDQWKIKIDGVDIYDGYIAPHIQYIYSTIYIGHIHRLINNLLIYDVILLIDVLEHMAKWKGIEVVKALYEKTNKLMLFSFPNKFSGGECSDWPNRYEEHRCLWTQEELDNIIGETKKLGLTLYAKFK
jgi:2-polyprenyl-3-methyl-5-hydroxy-6-metoxy-1,4-benzoquinol methylase